MIPDTVEAVLRVLCNPVLQDGGIGVHGEDCPLHQFITMISERKFFQSARVHCFPAKAPHTIGEKLRNDFRRSRDCSPLDWIFLPGQFTAQKSSSTDILHLSPGAQPGVSFGAWFES